MELEQELENVKTLKTKLGIVRFFLDFCFGLGFLLKTFLSEIFKNCELLVYITSFHSVQSH